MSLSALPPDPSGQYFYFDETSKRLTIDTPMLALSLEGGAVVYVKDKSSGEVLVDRDSSTNFPTSPTFPSGDPRGFVSFTSRSADGNQCYRQPKNSAVAYTQVSRNQARLTYSPLYFVGSSSGCGLTYNVTVDEGSGEVVVQLTGVETEAKLSPFTIDFPIMNFMGASTIVGTAKYARRDSKATGYSSQPGAGLFSPNMAVAEGINSCLAAWSESDRNLEEEYVKVMHDPSYDHTILHTPQDPQQSDVTTIVSSPWRIGTYKNWLEAARRWRTRFEQQTQAKPLWKNTSPWVRNIHAVHVERYDNDTVKYDELAALVTPTKLLWFLWNGDRIVLFGDHTLGKGSEFPLPTIDEIVNIKAPRPGAPKGWPLVLYHPWVLYMHSDVANTRLASLAAKNQLPDNYKFNPDYVGADEPGYAVQTQDDRLGKWDSYWADISSTDNGSVHPGATKFKNYLIRNYGDYCATHSANGCYFDVLGHDASSYFAVDRKVIEGQDFATGERNAIARLNRDLPNLPVMSEYIPTRLIPYVFYTWEGYRHVTAAKVNHPLRTALIGSYVWSREKLLSQSETFDNEASALLGALPTLSPVGDYKVSKSQALWSQARAKLFCEEELFNDLPPKWDPAALAYYRSKRGNWFKFKKLGENKYAYVEELPRGGDRIRLTNFR